MPTVSPSVNPTKNPSINPTTKQPTVSPTWAPGTPTFSPTAYPTLSEVIVCDGVESCRKDSIVCSGNADCIVQCNGGSACREMTITCPANHDCTFECIGTANYGCGRDTKVNAQSSSKLTLIGDGFQTFHSVIANCPTNGGSCEIICGPNGYNTEGCVWMKIKAEDSGSLNIYVPSGGDSVLFSAWIRCP